MKKKVRVIVVQVGKEPEIREIDNELESYQHIVGGYIQEVPLAPGVSLVCNEEGKLRDLPANRTLVGPGGADTLVGDFCIVRAKDSEYVSLTDDDIAFWLQELKR